MKLNSKKDFTVYLSSLGSKSYFPDNNNDTFANVLHKPLLGMNNYEVCMIACYLSSLVSISTILVCTDIVVPTFYNEKQMPVIGVYSPNISVKPVYMPLATNTISMITIKLRDVYGAILTLPAMPLVVLHFKEK